MEISFAQRCRGSFWRANMALLHYFYHSFTHDMSSSASRQCLAVMPMYSKARWILTHFYVNLWYNGVKFFKYFQEFFPYLDFVIYISGTFHIYSTTFRKCNVHLYFDILCPVCYSIQQNKIEIDSFLFFFNIMPEPWGTIQKSPACTDSWKQTGWIWMAPGLSATLYWVSLLSLKKPVS